MNVVSRANRILRHLNNYQDLMQDKMEIPAYIPKNIIQENEYLVGLYENFPGEMAECIIVTNYGLHFCHQNGWKFIGFEQMVKTEILQNKENATKISITTADDRVMGLPVLGRKGRFRDIFEFWRFLNRVTKKDMQ